VAAAVAEQARATGIADTRSEVAFGRTDTMPLMGQP
jgi:hypothetical protein